MMMSLAESHDDKLKRTDEEAAEQEKMLAKLGACAEHRPASLNTFPVATLCATSRPLTRSPAHPLTLSHWAGLGSMSEEDMKKTPSLRNLNQVL